MTLEEFRTRLVDRTGRFDFVVDAVNADYTDVKANGYINDGCRVLDRMFSRLHKGAFWFTAVLAAGEVKINFVNARIVREVWVATATTRTKLKKVSPVWMMEQYPDTVLADIEGGVPAYWTTGLYPVAQEVTPGAEVDDELYVDDDPTFTRGLYIMPPPDETYTIKMLGDWAPVDLAADGDVNFWTMNPDILEKAVRMEIETSYHRNTQGRRDFEEALMADVRAIQRDLTAERWALPADEVVMNG